MKGQRVMSFGLERGSMAGRMVASGQLLGMAGLQSWSRNLQREVSVNLCWPPPLSSPSLSFQVCLCFDLTVLISFLSLFSLTV